MINFYHLLKIADRYGWGAVSEFTEVELARNKVEEEKLKKFMKRQLMESTSDSEE